MKTQISISKLLGIVEIKNELDFENLVKTSRLSAKNPCLAGQTGVK